MKLQFIFSILIFSFFTSSAINIDSLKQAIAKMPDDTNKVNALLLYSDNLLNDNSSEISSKLKEALKIAVNLKYSKGIVLSYHQLCIRASYSYNHIDTSLYYANKALENADKYSYTNFNNEIYYSIGGAYLNSRRYDLSLENFIKSIEFSQKKDDSLYMYKAKLLMADAYVNQENYKAFDDLVPEIEIFFKKKKNNYSLAQLYQSKAIRYEWEGDVDKALQFYNKTLVYLSDTTIREKSQKATIYAGIAKLYQKQKKYENALEYINTALGIMHELKMYSFFWKIQIIQADILGDKKEYKLAIEVLDSIEKYSNQYLETNIQDKYVFKKIKFDCYVGMKEYSKAFPLAEELLTLKDSTNKMLYGDKISKLQTQYETKEKEAQITSLAKEKQLEIEKAEQTKWFFVIVLIFIILVALLFYSRVKTRQKLILEKEKIKSEKEIVELEQKLLLTQMNPHFIFNSLNSIKKFIQKNDTEQATRYLADFAKLMRLILELSRQEFISLEDEIKILTYYLNLEKARLGNSFEYTFLMDELVKEEADTIQIPPMFLQPFIENAVKHGVENNSSIFGKIKISFKLNEMDNNLNVEIEDNGIGVNASKEKLTVAHSSLALGITQERAEAFKKKYHKEIAIKIIDLGTENKQLSGTRVSMELPLVA